jgi:DNA mismatch repair protein MutS
MSIINEYLNHQKKYEKKYGINRTLVLMQVGSFHESYATEEIGPDLRYISNMLNIVVTRKNKSIKEVSMKNPLMLGFPSLALQKFLNILIENQFTVIIIDQVTPPPKPKREITGIYSPGTHIDRTFNNNESNYIVSICIQEEKQLKKNYKLLCVGLSAIDLSIGNSFIYQTYSRYEDKYFALDETLRFINHYNPKEIIISINNGDFSKEIKQNNYKGEVIKDFSYLDLLSYLNINDKIVHLLTSKEIKDRNKISFQNQFLKKIFPDNGMLSPIEYLGLEREDYCRLSFILLLEYAYSHSKNIILNIKKPEIFDDKKYLHLGNNAIYQLDVLGNKQCLFDIINKTSTPMGSRYLKNLIASPMIDVKKINLSYDSIDKMLNESLFCKFEEELNGICDIERLHRRISLHMLHPYEFYNLINCYENINKVIQLIVQHNFLLPYDVKLTNNQIVNFIDKYQNIFNMEEISKYNLTDITNSFFNQGYSKDIDDLQKKINKSQNFIEDLADELTNHIEDKNYFNKSDKRLVRIEYKDKDGHYLLITKRRLELLKKGLKNKKSLNINGTLIPINKLEFKPLPKSSNVKIYIDDITSHSNNIILYQDKIRSLVKNKYLEILDNIFKEYNIFFNELVNIVSIIDFFKSGAKVSKQYNYCKPNIASNNNQSYFKSNKMRHPIVEKINIDTEYITNDISLGCEFNNENINGILLYGLNSAGKSTLMKAIGLNIILAQIGYFVACSEFTYYPYKSLFTRISGNDNIFKGMSSFMVEMIELRAILKRNNQNSLVICDEICRGTEVKSANIIVTAMIDSLSKSGASFITATHLHQLAKLKRIESLDNVQPYHLHVEFDNDNNLLIFDRKLKKGSGKSYYGLDVAQYVMDDLDFIKKTREIEKEINGIQPILTTNKSKYNNNVYMDECLICSSKENLEMHHIEWQKDCDSNGFILSKSHVNKNHSSNLMPVCQTCHDDIDRDKIRVNGYEQTSKGSLLKWEYVTDTEKKSKRKYNNKDIKIILGIKNEKKITQINAKKLLLKKYNIKISTNTIRKIWNNEYVI